VVSQKGDVTAYTARATIQLFRQMFEGRVISHGCDINWSPCSPDLTTPDFFLWGSLKEKV